MGYLRSKYTYEYFTGRKPNGEPAGYGVEGYDAFLEGKIREIDLSILSRLNLKNTRVLEFGFGRGEAIKYVIDHGAVSYTGVDFAKPAVRIAKKFIASNGVKGAKLYCDDALAFVKKLIKRNLRFDVVLMFDFVEHVPRRELAELFDDLHKVLSPTAVIAINTPCFRFDNDVISEGFDERNAENTNDFSDLRPETQGMHCNKYTVISLKHFMRGKGYKNISEYHFFVSDIKNKDDAYPVELPFRYMWEKAVADGYPLKKQYNDDVIEYAYIVDDLPTDRKIRNGHLSGISLYLTDFYQRIAFPNGEHDRAMFDDFESFKDKDLIVFDIGGFMGVSSLLFSKLMGDRGQVITFEPNPYNLNRIQRNLSHNPLLSQKIILHPIALGNLNGSIEMLVSNQVDNGYSSTSRLMNTHVEHSHDHLRSIGFVEMLIPIDTLDNYVTSTGRIPDLIKVDIEGAEHLFLLGAKKTLETYSPVLYIELHSQYCAMMCQEILQFLGYDYQILHEESDNRLIVKYVRGSSRRRRHYLSSDKIAQESTILSLQKELGVYQAKFIKQQQINEQKIAELTQRNASLQQQIEEYLLKLNSATEQAAKYESYLLKLLHNPLIKAEISIARLIKHLINTQAKI